MNSMSLKDKLKNVANQKNVDFNSVLRMYMYDRFIERLAVSPYKDNFILKGGFYLSTLFGIENRATMDIDAVIKNTDFSKVSIIKMISDIISIDISDHATIELIGIEDIREEDEYGGYRVNLLVKLDNIKEQFQIDIATGDPITPKEIVYQYLPILGDKYIHLWSYNMETVLAEKLETILSRAEASSRIRDYYDVYLIYKMCWESIEKENFRKAVENTFKKREFKGDMLKILELIKNSNILRTRWQLYSKRNKYAEGVRYEEVTFILFEITAVLSKITSI